jgi:hypothetical protein
MLKAAPTGGSSKMDYMTDSGRIIGNNSKRNTLVNGSKTRSMGMALKNAPKMKSITVSSTTILTMGTVSTQIFMVNSMMANSIMIKDMEEESKLIHL